MHALRRRYGHAGNAAITSLVDKYMRMLGVSGDPPVIKVRSVLGAHWLGRTKWSSRNPHTTTIELQRGLVGDARTLERIVAHEMVHHRDLIAMTEQDIAVSRIIKPESHGATFLEGAQIINSVMGPDFVTITSDKDYVQATHHSKELYVLIAPVMGGTRLGWKWAARLSPEATAVVAEKAQQGGRLVRTTDLQWALGKAKIHKYGGWGLPPQGGPMEAALAALYASASPT